MARRLVKWHFEPSQPQGIVSELKESFIKIYTFERTHKAEIKPEEQSEKTDSYQENLLNEMQLKVIKTEIDTKNIIERSGHAQ